MVIPLPPDKVIITVAQTGAFLAMDSPYAPSQPDEISQSAYDCYNEGAAIVHVHARDSEGKPSVSPKIFGEIHGKIRAKCPIILQDTTGGGTVVLKDETGATVAAPASREQRIDCLDADPPPDMASLNMGTQLFTVGPRAGSPWMNPRDYIEFFATQMREKGIKPVCEVYQPGMLRELKNVIDKDLLEKPYYVDLIHNTAFQGAIEANPRYLTTYLDLIPEDSIFCCLSREEGHINLITLAMILGGCIRTGFEDVINYRHYPKEELATSNAQLVARVVRIARELGKEPATPEEARKILGMKPL
jgi:3-keto-5-aminohexanoate cleavage enzyme